jgi:superfamily II DNA or RNA helicase
MDAAVDRSFKGRPQLEVVKNSSHLFGMDLPPNIEEAVLLVHALSFGPLTRNDLTATLKQAGMTMSDGSSITAQKLGLCLQRLREQGRLVSLGSEPPQLSAQARAACIEEARGKGWLRRLGRALQQTVPSQLAPSAWEYKWGRRRFISFSHACRDVFLALEENNQDELARLAVLCREDERVRSLADVLLVVCMEPFQPDHLKRLPAQYQNTVLFAALHQKTCDLALDHPIFAYMRNWIADNRQHLDGGFLALCINHIAERDILAGDLSAARTLLDAFGDLNTHLIRGMLELLSGRLQEAHTAYNQGLQKEGKTKKAQLEYLESFPSVLHTLLLVQSERPQDRQLVRAWLDWIVDRGPHTTYHAAYRFADTLLAFYEGYGTDELGPVWPAYYRENTPLTSVGVHLVQLLYWLYTSDAKTVKSRKQTLVPAVEDLLRYCSEHGARWPVMQIARLMGKLGVSLPAYSAQADAFFGQGQARDLSELWPVKAIWESRLGALEQVIQEAEHPEDRPVDSSRRLAWKLREGGYHSQIEVVPVEQKRTKTGTWTKGREIPLSQWSDYLEGRGSDFLIDQDRAAMTAALTKQPDYYNYGYNVDPGAILRALVGHPNIFWQDHPGVPVEVVLGTPQVRITPKGSSLCIRMDPYPSVDADDTPDSTYILKESPTRVRVVVFDPIHLRMAEVLGEDGVAIPKDRSEESLKRLQGLSKHVAIESDVALAGTEAEAVEPDCRPHLRLQRLGQGLQVEMVVVPLAGQSQRASAPGVGTPHLVESVAGKTLQTRRNLEEETHRAQQALDAIKVLNATGDGDYEYSWILDDPEQALELLEHLQAVPAEVLSVEWPKGDPITVRSISPQQFQLSIHSAHDWFEVEGEVQVDQNLMIKMHALLDEIESTNTRFISLGKDQYAVLSRQLRKQLQWLSASGQFSGSKSETLRVHPLAAIGLEQWKDEVGKFKADAAFNASIERFRQIVSYQPAVPSTLQATLRPYQTEGFVWLARLAQWGVGACLADDMGLGKTVEALALILHRAAQGPTLVAAPTSVCANWVSEAQRFAPTLRPVRFGIGDLGRRDDILKAVGPFDLVICSYTLLQQEAAAIKDVRFATIVLDEAQMIKNAATKRSSAAMSLTGGFRMMCTGTPIENRLAELWNLFRFINPGLLGSEERFRDRFVRPIEAVHDAQASHILKSLVQPFILRRTKSQVLEDLPPRTEMMRLVELSEEERALHESLRRRALERLEGMRDRESGQARIQVLAELMKLRRCCCNPRLVMPDCGLTGSKLEAFAELVEELLENQHKALVFSQFVDHLTLLREHLDKQGIHYQYLDGQTPPKTRQRRIDAFQNGEGDLFLISLKAGGLGLNLTAADYVIHMDPWWNPAVEDQASDRAHRIGQTRPVTIYRLVAADTIEEKIVQLHHAKRDLADSLLEGTDTAHTLTADELINLLRNR